MNVERELNISKLKAILFQKGVNQTLFSEMLGMHSKKALWNCKETAILNNTTSFNIFLEGFKQADPTEINKYYQTGFQISMMDDIDLVGLGEIQKLFDISQALTSYYTKNYDKINLGFRYKNSKTFITRENFNEIKARMSKK